MGREYCIAGVFLTGQAAPIVIPICCSNKFVLLKNHATKQVTALREGAYLMKRKKVTEY